MKKNLFDDLDIFVFQEIFVAFREKQETTNWEIAKKWAELNSINHIKVDTSEITRIYKRIMWRLKSYCKVGIFVASIKDKDIPFELLEDEEILKKVEFKMNFDKVTFGKYRFDDEMKRCLVLRIESPVILQDTCRKTL